LLKVCKAYSPVETVTVPSDRPIEIKPCFGKRLDAVFIVRRLVLQLEIIYRFAWLNIHDVSCLHTESLLSLSCGEIDLRDLNFESILFVAFYHMESSKLVRRIWIWCVGTWIFLFLFFLDTIWAGLIFGIWIHIDWNKYVKLTDALFSWYVWWALRVWIK